MDASSEGSGGRGLDGGSGSRGESSASTSGAAEGGAHVEGSATVAHRVPLSEVSQVSVSQLSPLMEEGSVGGAGSRGRLKVVSTSTRDTPEGGASEGSATSMMPLLTRASLPAVGESKAGVDSGSGGSEYVRVESAEESDREMPARAESSRAAREGKLPPVNPVAMPAGSAGQQLPRSKSKRANKATPARVSLTTDSSISKDVKGEMMKMFDIGVERVRAVTRVVRGPRARRITCGSAGVLVQCVSDASSAH